MAKSPRDDTWSARGRIQKQPPSISTILGPLKKWNAAFKCDDESIVTAVIKISPGTGSKRAEVMVSELPKDWETRKVDRLRDHGRVLAFRAAIRYEEFDNHSFPDMVDFVLQRFGQRTLADAEDHRITLSLPGRLVHPDTEMSVSGVFEVTFVEEDGRKLIIHRLLRPPKFNWKTVHAEDRQALQLERWQTNAVRALNRRQSLKLLSYNVVAGEARLFGWFRGKDEVDVDFFLLRDIKLVFLLGDRDKIDAVLQLLAADDIILKETVT